MSHEDLAAIRAHADNDQGDVAAQIDAAYACDREGEETDAANYYDRAWALGVPGQQRHDFLIGYGSTLRNVGRLDESLQILGIAAEEYRGDLAPLAFMALTLHSADRSGEAVALLLDCLVDSGVPGIPRFGRALRSYAELLRA